MRPGLFSLSAFAALMVATSLSPLKGQAFTAPQGIGQVTLAWQMVDNTGHRFSDGFLRASGQSVTMSALLEVDYGITDRLSATAAVPYVFARYSGAMPPPSRLPVDACGCWHSSLQDFSLSARYRFGDNSWALTPVVRYVLPSHDYEYQGEAVVGRNLEELQVGVHTGLRLPGVLKNANLQSGYTYSFVEKPIRDISIDRSNAFFDAGYALTSRLSVRASANWLKTHGGLQVGSPTGNPFFPPGELNTPERFAQRDRLLSVEYWQAGAGVSYAAGPVDIFAAYTKYIWGRNAHDGQAYTVGTTWYFDRWNW